MVRLLAVHPVIDVRDVQRSTDWFCSDLGFELLFVDNSSEAGYAGAKFALKLANRGEPDGTRGSVDSR